MIKSYCLSLINTNTDDCQAQFNKYNLDVDIMYNERSPINGTHGCFMSHIQALTLGLTTDAKYIMIFEDDVYFMTNDLDPFGKITEFIETLTGDFCLTLGYMSASAAAKLGDFIKLANCYCTHAYIVPRSTAKRLIDLPWNDIPYDMAWNECIDQFYACYPMIAYQRDRLSSVSNDLAKTLTYYVGFKNICSLCEYYCCEVQSVNWIGLAILMVVFVILLIFNSDLFNLSYG